MKNFFCLLVLSLMLLSCSGSKKGGIGDTLGLYFILKERDNESDAEESEKINVDFSGISENLHAVLAYKEKKETTDSLVNFLLSDDAKTKGWKEIPSSKKIEIGKGQKIELSLGGVVLLGEKKIDTKTNLTLISVMGNEQKVKNFKYLALSLSSKKSGKLDIKVTDLAKLKDKEVDFEKTYEEFKRENVITTALQGKTVASDQEVNDYSTKGTEPTDPNLKDAPVLSKTKIGDEKLKASWNAVEGADKYKVFYGEKGSCDKSKKDACTTKEQTETSLTLDSLTNGKKYNIFVVGLDSSGKELTNLSKVEVAIPKTKVGFFITSEGSVTTAGAGTRVDFSGGNLGGIAGADAQCKKLGEAAGLGGRDWKAFLFTTTEDAHDRIGSGPWYNVDKAKIGDNVQALKDQKSTAAFLALLKDERRANITNEKHHDIMIGTTANNCQNWTSKSNGDNQGAIGHGSIHNSDVNNAINQWLTGVAHRGDSCDPGTIKRVWGLGKFYCFASDSNPEDL